MNCFRAKHVPAAYITATRILVDCSLLQQALKPSKNRWLIVELATDCRTVVNNTNGSPVLALVVATCNNGVVEPFCSVCCKFYENQLYTN